MNDFQVPFPPLLQGKGLQEPAKNSGKKGGTVFFSPGFLLRSLRRLTQAEGPRYPPLQKRLLHSYHPCRSQENIS